MSQYRVTYDVRRRGAIGVASNRVSVLVEGPSGITNPPFPGYRDPTYKDRVVLMDAASHAFSKEHAEEWEPYIIGLNSINIQEVKHANQDQG